MASAAEILQQEKVDFTNKMMDKATAMAVLLSELYAGVEVYQERGYGPSEQHPPTEITNEDTASLGITADVLTGIITMAIQIKKLNVVNPNDLPVQGWYAAVLAKCRKDF